MSESTSPRTETSNEPWVQVLGSRYFAAWLAEHRVSLAFTTYQAGKLFFLGRKADEQLSVFERTFNRCMGLWAAPDAASLWMSSKYQLWKFENVLAKGQMHDGYDALYVPRTAHTTGDLDIHDVVVEQSGRVVFANTMFNCLGTISEQGSFSPLWRPPFISALAAQDRCHLNGLAMRDGRARYVTVVSKGDVVDAWRDRRRDGGCVIDVQSGETVASGLSMPHSPRWHHDTLWVHNSGTGEFGKVDLKSGKFEPIVFCPGYLRGLAFVGDFALLTLSKPRDATFSGLVLAEKLKEREAEAQCGIQVVDLRSGQVVHWVRIEGIVSELYDVVVLLGLSRPMALGLKTDDIARLLTLGPPGVL